MKILTETSLAAVFHHLAEFLRKTGELGIFDTLVHNYRLKESLSLSPKNLQDFTKDLQYLLTSIQNLLNSNTPLSDVNSNQLEGNGSTITSLVPVIQPVENSIEINWIGGIQQQAKELRPPRAVNVNRKLKITARPKAEVERQSDELFCCKVCRKIYRSKSSYTEHSCPKQKSGSQDLDSALISSVSELRNLKRFRCGNCFEVMHDFHVMKTHISSCGDEPFTCEFCENNNLSVQFKTLKLLNQHKRTAHPDSKCFSCNECHLAFQSNQSLLKHKRRRHDVRPSIQCSSCPMTFDRRIQLTNHRLKVHSEAKICSTCGVSCASDASLLAHVTLKHKNESGIQSKKFQCTFCSKEFPRKDKLQFHLSTHTGQKPFICASCGKAFSRKFKLDEHEARHLGVKKYACKNCPKTYASNTDLKIHTLKQHPQGSLPGNPQGSLSGNPQGSLSGNPQGIPEIVQTKKRTRKPTPKKKSKGTVVAIPQNLVENQRNQNFLIPVPPISEEFNPLPQIQYESLEAIGLEAQQQFEYTNAEIEPLPPLPIEYPVESYFLSDSVQNAALPPIAYEYIHGEDTGIYNEDQYLQAPQVADNSYNFYPQENFASIPESDHYGAYDQSYATDSVQFEIDTSLASNYVIAENSLQMNGAQMSTVICQYDGAYQQHEQLHYTGNVLETQFQGFQNHFQATTMNTTESAISTIACAEFSVSHQSAAAISSVSNFQMDQHHHQVP